MHPLRRRFLAGSTLLAAAPIVNSMPSSGQLHLLGDSIFDNAAYAGGQPDSTSWVISIGGKDALMRQELLDTPVRSRAAARCCRGSNTKPNP